MFDFTRLYKNVLEETTCDKIIQMFEDSKDEYEERNIENYIKFTELNINKNSEKWSDLIEYFLYICREYSKDYKFHFGIDDHQFPNTYAFEEIRIKRYLPNDFDEFKLHVDVQNKESSKRYLSFLFYLNTVEVGGETTFGRNDEIIIPPERGNLLMFPPLWTHIHTGKKPISGPKYIVTTYNEYV